MCDSSKLECMMYHCTNYPGTKALRKFLDGVHSDIDPHFQFHYSRWQTGYKASLVIATSTCEEYKTTSSSLCKMKSKVTIGIKNTAYYTQSLYILLMVMEIINTVLFLSSLMIKTTIQMLFIKYKQYLLITLKETFQLWIWSSISLTTVLNNITIAKLY